MASNGVTTDLIIRTKEIQTKPLAALLEILGKLTGALDSLGKEGGPASKNIAELRSEAEKFEKLSNEIAGRRALFESFKATKDGAALAAAALEKAKAELASFSEGLPAAKKRTEEQAEGLRKLQTAAKQASDSFRNSSRTLASSTAGLERIGVTADTVAAELQKLIRADEDVAVGLERATKNVQGYYEAVRAGKAAAQAATEAAQKQAAALAQIEAAQRAANAATAAAPVKKAVPVNVAADLMALDLKAQQQALDITKRLTQAREQAADAATRAARVHAGVSSADASLASLDKLRASPAAETLAKQIQALAAPAKQAALAVDDLDRTLTSIEARQKTVGAAFRLQGEDAKALAADHRTLQQALANVQKQADAITGFKTLSAELQRVDGALQAARAQLLAFGRATDAANGDPAALEKQIATVARLTKEYDALAPAVVAQERKLAGLGVQVGKLEPAELSLISATSRIRGALDAAGDATTQLGKHTAAAARETAGGLDLQRTSLSLYQRVRGQVLSLTAAYVGLFGVINDGKATLGVAQEFQKINTRLAVAFGTQNGAVADEMQFVRATADRLGLDLQSAAEAYSKFGIAARAAGLDVNDTRKIFESFSQVSRVFGLSQDDSLGVFRALEQSLSKGKISAEELRGQLGDRLPGAVTIFAKAIGVTTAELDDLLKAGKVLAPASLKLFADEYAKSIQGQLVPASVRFDAEVGRLKTSLLDFRAQVADAGFLDSMTTLAKSLSSFLGSEQGAETARKLGAGFAFLADSGVKLIPILSGLVDGITRISDGVTAVVGPVLEFGAAIAGVRSATSGLEMVGEFVALVAAIVSLKAIVSLLLSPLAAAAGEAGLLRAAVAAGGVAFTAAGGAVTGFGAAFLAATRTVLVGLGPVGWVTLLAVGLFGIVTAARAAGTEIDKAIAKREELERGKREERKTTPGVQAGDSDEVVKVRRDLKEAQDAEARLRTEKTRLEKTKTFSETRGSARPDEAVRTASDIEIKTRSLEQASAVVRDQQLKLKQIQAGAADKNRGLLNAADKDLNAQKAGLTAEQIAAERKKAIGGADKPVAGAGAAARAATKDLRDDETIIKQIESGLNALETSASKKLGKDSQDVADSIERQYRPLLDKIAEISKLSQSEFDKVRADLKKNPLLVNALGKEGVAAIRDAKTPAEFEKVQRERAKKALQALQDKAVADAQRKESQERVDALLAERDALVEVKKVEASLDPAKRATALTDETAILVEYRDKILEASRAALVLAEAQGKVIEAAKLRGLIAKTEAQDPEREKRVAQLADLQKEIASVIALRDAKIALAVENANQIDPTGALAQQETVRILTETRDRLLEIATAGRAAALSLNDPAAVAALDLFIAKTSQISTQTTELSNKLANDLVGGLSNVGVAAVEGLGQFLFAGDSLKDSFKGAEQAFKSFAATFLSEIVKMIIQAQVLKAIQGIKAFSDIIARAVTGVPAGASAAGSGFPGFQSSFGYAHNGGVIGAASGDWGGRMSASVFSGAQRFHAGGLPGLKSDEVPAILQKGEEVLAKNDARNALNGGLNARAAAAAPQQIKIINTIDPNAVVSEGLSSAAGERAFINRVSSSRDTMRKILGVK